MLLGRCSSTSASAVPSSPRPAPDPQHLARPHEAVGAGHAPPARRCHLQGSPHPKAPRPAASPCARSLPAAAGVLPAGLDPIGPKRQCLVQWAAKTSVGHEVIGSHCRAIPPTKLARRARQHQALRRFAAALGPRGCRGQIKSPAELVPCQIQLQGQWTNFGTWRSALSADVRAISIRVFGPPPAAAHRCWAAEGQPAWRPTRRGSRAARRPRVSAWQ
mmetsp:Transcript_136710/g.323891  ORF Transcript_136710/g.323891 Transcript_136710/m.323891 type:complete len:218 (+) Transcript_136710:2172-2825(+)